MDFPNDPTSIRCMILFPFNFSSWWGCLLVILLTVTWKSQSCSYQRTNCLKLVFWYLSPSEIIHDLLSLRMLILVEVSEFLSLSSGSKSINILNLNSFLVKLLKTKINNQLTIDDFLVVYNVK